MKPPFKRFLLLFLGATAFAAVILAACVIRPQATAVPGPPASAGGLQ